MWQGRDRASWGRTGAGQGRLRQGRVAQGRARGKGAGQGQGQSGERQGETGQGGRGSYCGLWWAGRVTVKDVKDAPPNFIATCRRYRWQLAPSLVSLAVSDQKVHTISTSARLQQCFVHHHRTSFCMRCWLCFQPPHVVGGSICTEYHVLLYRCTRFSSKLLLHTKHCSHPDAAARKHDITAVCTLYSRTNPKMCISDQLY